MIKELTKINENDTIASAFLKGYAETSIKVVIIGGLAHLGLKMIGNIKK